MYADSIHYGHGVKVGGQGGGELPPVRAVRTVSQALHIECSSSRYSPSMRGSFAPFRRILMNSSKSGAFWTPLLPNMIVILLYKHIHAHAHIHMLASERCNNTGTMYLYF